MMKKLLLILYVLIYPFFVTEGIENLFQPSLIVQSVHIITGKYQDEKEKLLLEIKNHECYESGSHAGKVRAIKALAGSEPIPMTIFEYRYFDDFTEVYDAMGNKTIYRYSPNQQILHAVEKYAADQLVLKERFFWKSVGNDKSMRLISHSIENGDKQILLCRTFEYTPYSQLEKITLFGNLTGKNGSQIQIDGNGIPINRQIESYSVSYEYCEKDPCLLHRELEQNGKSILYAYAPGTQRIEGRFICEQGSIIQRIFYRYNSTDQLIETIEDDGCSLRSSDLNAATKRTIKRRLFQEGQSGHVYPSALETYIYDFEGKIEKCIERRVFHYNSDGEISCSECYDETGNCIESTKFQYNKMGLPILSEDIEGNRVEKTYDANGNCVQMVLTFPDGKTLQTKSNFDSCNRLVREEEIDPEGKVLSKYYTYDLCGNMRTASDGLGNETFYEYDFLGRNTKIVLPGILNGEDRIIHPAISMEYDLFNRNTATIDPNGYRTEIAYNVRGQPTGIYYPDGSRESFEYHVDGSLAKSTSKAGAFTQFETNCEGHPTAIRLFDSDVNLCRSINFDYKGSRLLSATDSEGKTGTFGEEAATSPFSNMAQAQKPASHPSIYSMEKHVLNDRGQYVREKMVVAESGETTLTLFDALGRVEKITQKNPFGMITKLIELRWDGSQNKILEKHRILSSSSSPKEYIVAWKYGPCGHLEEQIEGAGTEDERKTTYVYNSCGQLSTCIKPDGTALNYAYNSFGDVVKLWSPENAFCYLYTYDSCRNLIKVEDSVSGASTQRSYDQAGNIISENLGNGIVVKREFDEQGRCTQLTLPDNSSIAYDYDGENLSAVRRQSPFHQYTHRYNPSIQDSKINSAELVEGVGILTTAYDAENRLQSLESPFWSEKIHYGNGRDQISSIDIDDAAGAFSTNYQYDLEGRVTAENDLPFAYDSVDNRTLNEKGNWTYDSHQQLVQGPKKKYRYDLNGNLIQKSSDKETTLYQYDPLDRLICVTKPDQIQAKYTYDAFNRRLSKAICTWNCSSKTWEEKEIRYFLYDSEKEIGSLDSLLSIQELRILGKGLGAEIGSAVALEINDKIYVPLHDHRGSVCCLIDAELKKIVEFSRFNAFGEESLFSNCSSGINPWRFSSKRIDEESGLINFGKRYYDPESGRWTTQDPLGFVDGINRYRYVSNNPVSRLDLYGLFSFSSAWQNFSAGAYSAYKSLSTVVNAMDRFITHHLSYYNYAKEDIEQTAEMFFRKSILTMIGFYPSHAKSGVYGSGEISDKVRITMINGILNIHDHFLGAAAMISDTHGKNNVHYVFRPTEGWAWDLLKSFATKLGYIPPQSRQLAETWKAMIEEMGGIEGGGVIYHYAHSIGGTDTLAAKRLLSPEEQKMICVITFGSATMVEDKDFRNVTNFISLRDGVCMLDPIGYFKGFIGFQENVVFLGTIWGIPIIDHAFGSTTYRTIIEALGQQFIKTYFL